MALGGACPYVTWVHQIAECEKTWKDYCEVYKQHLSAKQATIEQKLRYLGAQAKQRMWVLLQSKLEAVAMHAASLGYSSCRLEIAHMPFSHEADRVALECRLREAGFSPTTRAIRNAGVTAARMCGCDAIAISWAEAAWQQPTVYKQRLTAAYRVRLTSVVTRAQLKALFSSKEETLAAYIPTFRKRVQEFCGCATAGWLDASALKRRMEMSRQEAWDAFDQDFEEEAMIRASKGYTAIDISTAPFLKLFMTRANARSGECPLQERLREKDLRVAFDDHRVVVSWKKRKPSPGAVRNKRIRVSE